jgi:hypothetical protein
VWFAPHAAGYSVGLGSRVAEGVIGALEAWVSGRAVPFSVG